MFLVSHDRRFLDNVVTSLICWEGDLSPGRWREYEGGIADWQAQRARMLAAQVVAAAPAPKAAAPAPEPAAAPAATRRKLSYKEQRERDELPARIAALEAEQATISARLADGTLFAKAPAEATALSQRHAAIDDELLAALERQEALGAS